MSYTPLEDPRGLMAVAYVPAQPVQAPVIATVVVETRTQPASDTTSSPRSLKDKALEKVAQATPMAEKFKAKGKEIYDTGKEKVQDLSAKGEEHAKEAVLAAYEKLNEEQKEWVREKLDVAQKFKDRQVERVEEIKERVEVKVDDFKERVEAKVQERVEAATRELEKKVVEKAGPYVDKGMEIAKKELCQVLTADPYMPALVRRVIAALLDGAWPDVVEEVKIELFNALRKTNTNRPDDPPEPCCWLRAQFRYAYMPYDRSFWHRIRTFGFWSLTILSMIPWFGIRAFYFFLVLLLIDYRDEFQLMRYIQSFKAAQFISGGIIAGVLGGFQYYACVNFTPRHLCGEKIWGPGQADHFFTQLFSFFGQILLTWAAFAFLPFSVQKGRKQFANKTAAEQLQDQVEEAKENWGCCGFGHYQFPTPEAEKLYNEKSAMKRERRRRLYWLLVIDLAGVLFVIILFGIAFAIKMLGETWAGLSFTEIVNSWQFKADFYYARILYSLMSFIFFLLDLPGINRLISNAPPTGYSRNGRCLPLLPPPKSAKPTADTVTPASPQTP